MRLGWFISGLLCIGLFGCSGSSGSDGTVYLAIDWQVKPKYYTDNNNDIPAGFIGGQFYQCQPGTYQFSYISAEDSNYQGKYELTGDPGEPGSFFWEEGRDGKPIYYVLWLLEEDPGFD